MEHMRINKPITFVWLALLHVLFVIQLIIASDAFKGFTSSIILAFQIHQSALPTAITQLVENAKFVQCLVKLVTLHPLTV